MPLVFAISIVPEHSLVMVATVVEELELMIPVLLLPLFSTLMTPKLSIVWTLAMP